MVGKYQAYPEYKDSRTEWYGDIPSHWSPRRVKFLIKNVGSGTSVNAIDTPAVTGQRGVLKTSCVYDGTFRPTENKVVVEEEVERLSCPVVGGSLIVSRMNTPDLVGAAGLVRSDCNDLFLPDRLWQVTFKNAASAFVHYWTLTKAYRSQVRMACTGTSSSMQNLSQDQFGNFELLAPPLGEQLTIGAFLDHETARIDRLIEKQQRLIELLKEKRQAVISHAVTKGLDPNVPMKDSGVEWLGQVPEHWQVSKLKWLATTTSGGTPTTSMQEEYYQDGQYPWVRTTDLNNSELYEVPVKITKQALADTACSVLPIGTVLIAMYGGAGSIGKHSLLRFESTINQAVCGVIPCQELDPEFLHLYVEFYRPYWMAGAEGTRKDPNIGQDHIRDLVIPVPPLPEQYQLVSKVKGHFQQFEALDTKAQKAIALMHERRTALISAAVTGKIDVRNWQPDTSTNVTESDLLMAAEQAAEYRI